MQTVTGHLGSIAFDGHTVTIEKKRRGAVRIPLSSIAAVSVEKAGIGMRAVRFAVAGGTMADKRHNTHKEFAQDPYALTFRSKMLPQFEALVQEIESARSSHLPS